MSRPPVSRAAGRGSYSNGRGDWDFTRADLMEPETFYRRTVGLDLRSDGSWLRGQCPLCRSKEESLLIDPKRGAFVCVVCGKRGKDILGFYQALRGVGFPEAARALSTKGGRP